MTSTSIAIVQYPPGHEEFERLQSIVGGPLRAVVVTSMTVGSPFSIIRFFAALRAETIYLPIFEESNRVYLPALTFLAFFIRAKKRTVIEVDGTTRPLHAIHALFAVFDLAVGFFESVMAAGVDWLQLTHLTRAPRIIGRAGPGRRVLYLKTDLWLGIRAGGSVAHTIGVIRGLMKRGYEVRLVTADAMADLSDEGGLETKIVPLFKTYVTPRELNFFRHSHAFIKCLENAAKTDFSFIYQRLSLATLAGVVISRRMRLPLVSEYNGSEVWMSRNWGRRLLFEKIAKKVENVCLRHSHAVVTVSDVLRLELIDRGVEPHRIIMHPNGTDPDAFDPETIDDNAASTICAEFGIPADAKLVTFVGTFGPWHGAEILGQAIRQLTETDLEWVQTEKVHFLFVGDGPQKSLVESELADPPYRSLVTFTGLLEQPKTPPLVLASDILVSPHVSNPDGSAFFGSPTKLFEYFAAAKPIIASDLFQIRDVMDGCPRVDDIEYKAGHGFDDASGILVTPGHPDELARAIRFLVDNPQWARKVGQNARVRALERHTWQHHVDFVVANFNRVLNAEGHPHHRPFRLLVNGLHSKSGGGVTYLRNMLPIIELDPRIDVHVCIHAEQADVIPLGLSRTTVHAFGFRLGFWRLLLNEQIEVPRLVKRIEADATLSPANYGPILAPNLVILLRNALSVAVVERRPLKLAYWALLYLATLLSLFVSRRAITVSEYARRAASGGLIGLFRDRLEVIPHGVSDIFSPSTEGAEREGFLLVVSDIYVQKNLKNLLHAFSRLKTGWPDIVLKIAGNAVDKQYFDELKQLVLRKRIDESVVFLGEVSPEALVDLYRRCGVFVFPSTVETFGNPLVEAMACGAPIACSQTAAMPEIVDDAAEFFDPRDIESIASAIERLMHDPDLKQRLSVKALRRARAFSWDRTAMHTLDLLMETADFQTATTGATSKSKEVE